MRNFSSKPALEKRLLDDMLERGDCGKANMERRRKCSWFVYYTRLTVRLLKFYVYCPDYVKKVAGKSMLIRMGFVLRGKPFGNSLKYNKEKK